MRLLAFAFTTRDYEKVISWFTIVFVWTGPERYFQHEKIKFVSPSSQVMFLRKIFFNQDLIEKSFSIKVCNVLFIMQILMKFPH